MTGGPRPGRIPAFAPASIATGAILPDEGRAALTGAGGLPSGALDAEHDGWAETDVPVLVRGQGRARVRILPLGWWGEPGGGYSPEADPGQLEALWRSMQAAGMHWAGNWRTLEELEDPDSRGPRRDSVGSYLAALRAGGATRASIWRYSETTGLALVRAGDEDLGTASLALHIVPRSWVSDPPVGVSKRRARDWEPVPGIDVTWSWSEVVDLHAERMRLLDEVDLNAAVVGFLARHPEMDDTEFRAGFASEAVCGAARLAVREILLETMRIQPDWDQPLDGIGEEIAAVMGARHPDLSDEARGRLGSYFTSLVR